MIFLIVTQVIHSHSLGRFYAYGPYVREMNLWIKYVDEVIIVAPVDYKKKPDIIDISYDHNRITFLKIPQFDILNIKAIIRTILLLPLIAFPIVRGMIRADHIHLRCPGNVGFIGCILQIFFPSKKKTAKYASNWDWNSHQPWSYRLQQRILRNTFLARNMTALVYGEWPDRTKNIKPFFTASYSEKERVPVHKTPLGEGVKLAFAGTLTENKNPISCAEALQVLAERGINASLTYCGDGPERQKIEEFISIHGLQDRVKLLGNVDSDTVKQVLQDAHFLIFLSRSEGWPKAVSEAMWWGCLPVTTPVSCVPWMLGQGLRGELVSNDVSQICSRIEGYISDQNQFNHKSQAALGWSSEYKIETLENEIKKIVFY